MSGSAAPFSAVSCCAEIYPYEGGQYVLQHGQIRQIIFEKQLYGGSAGTATIQLAPGGPMGSESIPDWIQIMTPMSLVLIAATRGGRSALMFSGVVVRPGELQEWRTTDQGTMAGRFQTFECMDFTWFFRSFNYYALTFMGLTQGTAVGEAMQFVPAGLAQTLDQGTLGGPGLGPADVAQRWYNKVMIGQGALMGKTFVPYSTSQQIMIGDILATMWENYPEAHIPYFDYFLAAEQSWLDKFMAILPMPWYEFFITTAVRDAYTIPQGSSGTTTPGWVFTVARQPLAVAAGPQLVARVNPCPAIGVDPGGPSFTDLDMSRWNGLPIQSPDPTDTTDQHSFFESTISFSAEGAANFYQLNPTAIAGLYVANNANNIPFPFQYIGAADPASVHRYGFRPSIGTFRWFADASGLNAQSANAEVNFPKTVATVLGRYVSYIHPLPLMARAEVTMPFAPDLTIGNRWEYFPFKDGVLWQFYIEGVRHNFVFGGTSTTTLVLGRGLPSSIYADGSQGGLLYSIITGNAMRQQGVYTAGLPQGSSPGLTLFTTLENAQPVMGQLSQVFTTPQMQ